MRVLMDVWFRAGAESTQAEAEGPRTGAEATPTSRRGTWVWDVMGELVGFAAVDLADRTLGDFELAVPTFAPRNRVRLPVYNLAAFAEEWSLPLATVVTWSYVSSVTHSMLLAKEVLGTRVLRLACRYRHGVRALGGGEFGNVLVSGARRDVLDWDALMAARSPDQLETARSLAAVSAVLDGVAMYVWRKVDPSCNAVVHGRLVEALRRRRAELNHLQSLIEFWSGVPLGPVVNDSADAFVRAVAGSSAGLSAVWSRAALPTEWNLADPTTWPGDGGAIAGGHSGRPEHTTAGRAASLVVAGDSAIPGRPRMGALEVPRRRAQPPAPDALALLQRRLRNALVMAFGDPARCEVFRGRLDGTRPDADDAAIQEPTEWSPEYSRGFWTSRLQLALLGAGARPDDWLERTGTFYCAVATTDASLALLRTGDGSDVLRVHGRGMMNVERHEVRVSAAMEEAIFAWLAGAAKVRLTLSMAAAGRRLRQQRQEITARQGGGPGV